MSSVFFNLLSIGLAVNLAYLALPRFRYNKNLEIFADKVFKEIDIKKNDNGKFPDMDKIAFVYYLSIGEAYQSGNKYFEDPGLDNGKELNSGLTYELTSRTFASHPSISKMLSSRLWFILYMFLRSRYSIVLSACTTLATLFLLVFIAGHQIFGWGEIIETFGGVVGGKPCLATILFFYCLLYLALPILIVVLGSEIFVKWGKKELRLAANHIARRQQAVLHDDNF